MVEVRPWGDGNGQPQLCPTRHHSFLPEGGALALSPCNPLVTQADVSRETCPSGGVTFGMEHLDHLNTCIALTGMGLGGQFPVPTRQGLLGRANRR